jgi:hypothetical protein
MGIRAVYDIANLLKRHVIANRINSRDVSARTKGHDNCGTGPDCSESLLITGTGTRAFDEGNIVTVRVTRQRLAKFDYVDHIEQFWVRLE